MKVRKNIVSLILEEKGRFLVERRKHPKAVLPEEIVFPSSYVKNGEEKESALLRGMREELGIIVWAPEIVYQAFHTGKENQRIRWYSCNAYKGSIREDNPNLFWIKSDESDILTHSVYRDALKAYLHKTKA